MPLFVVGGLLLMVIVVIYFFTSSSVYLCGRWIFFDARSVYGVKNEESSSRIPDLRVWNTIPKFVLQFSHKCVIHMLLEQLER